MHRPGLLQFQPNRKRLQLDSDLRGHNDLIGNGLQLQSPRPKHSRDLQRLLQYSDDQPYNPAGCFQSYRDSDREIGLERLSRNRWLDWSVFNREMYRTWLLQFFSDCDGLGKR